MPRAELAIDGLKRWGRDWSRNDRVQAAIDAGVATAAMAANEVLARVADVASVRPAGFHGVDEHGGFKVDLRLAKRLGLGHLIKRLRTNKDGTQDIELEPKLPALVKLGEHFKLWKGEAQPQVTLVDLAKTFEGTSMSELRREGRL